MAREELIEELNRYRKILPSTSHVSVGYVAGQIHSLEQQLGVETNTTLKVPDNQSPGCLGTILKWFTGIS